MVCGLSSSLDCSRGESGDNLRGTGQAIFGSLLASTALKSNLTGLGRPGEERRDSGLTAESVSNTLIVSLGREKSKESVSVPSSRGRGFPSYKSLLLCRSIILSFRFDGLRQSGSSSGRVISFLRRTTRCMAVRNSSKLKHPSLVTSESCQIFRSSRIGRRDFSKNSFA